MKRNQIRQTAENEERGSNEPLSLSGWEMGFEPTTLGTTIRYSNQLSYTHHQYRFSGNRLQKYYIFLKR